MTRLYLPTTMARLRDFVEQGVLTGVEPVLAESESEEDEYAAMLTAADLSQAMLTETGRRVVVVAESPDPGVVPLSDVVAVHADPVPVAPHADDLDDLAWYAVQELADLIG